MAASWNCTPGTIRTRFQELDGRPGGQPGRAGHAWVGKPLVAGMSGLCAGSLVNRAALFISADVKYPG
jgi:hypothetical protein